MSFLLGQWVEITGRTMLRPRFSLVGYVGRVISSTSDAPAGTVAVWMEWEASGVEDTTGLPKTINVDKNCVEPIEEVKAGEVYRTPQTQIKTHKKPQLRLV